MRFFNEVIACRIQLRILCAKIVMDRGTLENSSLYPFSLPTLIVINLKNHTQTLYKEDTTEYRKQQLFMNDNGRDRNDTPDS